MSATDDWWVKTLERHRKQGRADCKKGIYSPYYQGSDDPTDEDENLAYHQAWKAQRVKLGDKFSWS